MSTNKQDSYAAELAEAYSGVKGGADAVETAQYQKALERMIANNNAKTAVDQLTDLYGPTSTPETPVTTVIQPGASTNAHVGSSYPKPTGSTGYSGGGSVGNSWEQGVGKVFVQMDEKTLDGPYKITGGYRDWWDEATKYYTPVDTGAGPKAIIVPKDRVGFSYGSVKFNACVFTATDDYMTARWGRKLHFTDKEWMAEHQLSTDDGVPMEYMALVIHAMLDPYGMGVSAIRVRKGSLSAGDGLLPFINALGVNPFAMIDRETSNKDAAEKLGISLVEANKLWRVEFHEQPLEGCTIIGERGWSSGNGVSTGSGGGHARYLAPRSRANDWAISIAVAPVEQIEYLVPVVTPEYKARKGEATLDLDRVLTPDGNAPVAVRIGNTYYSPAEAAERRASGGKPSAGFSTPQQPTGNGHSTGNPGTSGLPAGRVGTRSKMKPIIAVQLGATPAADAPVPLYGSKGKSETRNYLNGFIRIKTTDLATGAVTTTIEVDTINGALEGTFPPTAWLEELIGQVTPAGHVIGEQTLPQKNTKSKGKEKKGKGSGKGGKDFTTVEEILRANPRQLELGQGTEDGSLKLVPDADDAEADVADMIAAEGGVGDDYVPQPDEFLLLRGTATDVLCGGWCGTRVPWTELVDGTDLCFACYDAAWQTFSCPGEHCQADYRGNFTPWFVSRKSEEGLTLFACCKGGCKQKIAVRDSETNPIYKPLLKLAKAMPDMTAEEFEEVKTETIEYLVYERTFGTSATDPASFDEPTTGAMPSANASTSASTGGGMTKTEVAAASTTPIPQRVTPQGGGQFSGLTAAQLMILQQTYQENGSAAARDELNRMTDEGGPATAESPAPDATELAPASSTPAAAAPADAPADVVASVGDAAGVA